jgi:hypothetical protein
MHETALSTSCLAVSTYLRTNRVQNKENRARSALFFAHLPPFAILRDGFSKSRLQLIPASQRIWSRLSTFPAQTVTTATEKYLLKAF